MQKRVPIPGKVQAEALIKSKRRCCLCVFLNGDLSIKRVQLAHIDHNRDNNENENIVALCLEHHDTYDSKTSQSKGITVQEVKYYRNELYSLIEKRDEQIELPILRDGEYKISNPGANLLGQILALYDRELAKIENNRKPNGVALFHISKVCVEQEGDFDSAKEALISLLLLSSAWEEKGHSVKPSPVPESSPLLFSIKLLKLFVEYDYFELFMDIIRRLRIHALIGSQDFSKLSEYGVMPFSSFNSIVEFFFLTSKEFAKFNSDYACDIINSLSDLIFGIGIILHDRGMEIPDHPGYVFFDGLGTDRGISDGQPKEMLPFVKLSYRFAMLPDNLFSHALSRKYKFHLHVVVDSKKGVDDEEALLCIKRWAVIPNYAISRMVVRNENMASEYKKIVDEKNVLGSKIVGKIKNFIVKEREVLYQIFNKNKLL